MSLAEVTNEDTNREFQLPAEDLKTQKQAVLATLLDTLDKADGAQRCAAVIALGQIAQDALVDKAPVVSALVAALRDEDEDVRVDAAVALGRLADPAAVAPLLENLTLDPCGDVKAAAIDSLVALRAYDAVPLLRELVTSRGKDVVWDGEELLDWDEWLDIQVKAVKALAELGVEEAAEDLAAALTLEEGQEISPEVMPALAKLGAPGLAQLRSCLTSESGVIRRRAAKVLPLVKNKDVEPLLTALLTSAYQDLRALGAQGWKGRKAQPKTLESLASDESAEVRVAAIEAMTTPSDRLLDRALKDHDAAVAEAAVNRLLAEPKLRDVPHLSKRLLNLLTRAPSHQVSRLVSLLREVAADKAEMNLRILLADRRLSPESRAALALTLANTENLSAKDLEDNVTALVAQVDDGERQVRFRALSALGEVAKAELGPEHSHAQAKARLALLWGLEGKLVTAPDEDEDLQAAAAEDETEAADAAKPDGEAPEEKAVVTADVAEEVKAPLGEETADTAQDETTTSTLGAILANKGPDYAEEVAEDVELTAEDLERLAMASQRRTRRKKVALEPEIALHEDVKRLSAQVLASVATEEVAEALVAALGGDDQEVRQIAAASLAQVCEDLESLPKVVRLRAQVFAREDDRLIRLQALRVLGASGSTDVVPTLKSLLEDPDLAIRQEVIRALGKTAEDVSYLLPLLEDPSYDLRRLVAEVLLSKGCEEALGPLLERALDNDGFIAPQLAALLRGWKREEATAFFTKVLGNEDQRRLWRSAVESLANLWMPSTPPKLLLV
ncbi:HEAT repeat domain-containing protein [Rhodovibrionaceae bacterium A322]